VIALIALAITCASAHAATTRAEYVAQANPVCHAAGRPVGKAVAVVTNLDSIVRAYKKRKFAQARRLDSVYKA
jgi:hypothetical protein